MDSVKISDFKTHCIAMLNKLKKRGASPIVVTSRGEPLAVIYPYQDSSQKRIIGGQSSVTEIIGEIVENDFSADWESLK